MDMRGSFALSRVKNEMSLSEKSLTPSFFQVSSKGTGP